MENRPESRSTTTGDDTATTTTTHRRTASTISKKPLTKPVAPRLSSTTSTRPAAVSRASSTTTPSSLSKPPTRPSATSTVRRPTSTIASTPSTLHRSRPSSASIDASGDESKREGITAKPKRMSLVSGTSTSATERSSTTRPGAATPVRRPTTTPSSTARTGVKSPTSSTRTPMTSSARTASTLNSQTRPLSATGSRTATTIAERKRLSTIPASPAVKGASGDVDEDKENESAAQVSKRPIRPVLGSRKSTRSVLIEQRIHEFELVNQMLQSAMANDGMDGEEQETVGQEAKETMAKLRADLAKIRTFEKEHGRLPNEAELTRMGDISEEAVERVEQEVAEEALKASDPDLNNLRSELEQSHAKIAALESRLEVMAQEAAVASASNTQDTTDASRTEHAEEIERLLADHGMKVEELEVSHKAEAKTLTAKHQAEFEALRDSASADIAKKVAEVEEMKQRLQSMTEEKSKDVQKRDVDLQNLRSELQNLRTSTSEDVSAKDTEIERMKTELQSIEESHRKVLSRHSDEAESLKAKVQDLEQSSSATSLDKDTQLETLKLEIQALREQKETASSDLTAEVEALRAELRSLKSSPPLTAAEPVRDVTSPAEAQELIDVRQKLEAAQTRHMAAKDNAKTKIAKLSDEHAKKMEELKRQHNDERSGLQRRIEHLEQSAAGKDAEITKMAHDHEQIQEELRDLQSLQKSQATHTSAIGKLQAELDNFKKSADSDRSIHEVRMRELQQGKEKIVSEHAAQIKQSEARLLESHRELASIKDSHADELAKTKSEATKAHEDLKTLKKKHAQQIRELEQQSQSVLKDLESLDVSNTSQIEQAKLEAENTQKRLLDEQAHNHAVIISEMEARLQSKQEENIAAQKRYEDQTTKLAADHASDRDAALAALASEHQKKLSEISEHSASMNNTAMEELKKAHAEKIRQIESNSKSTSAEADAARFQIQTLKNILKDVENEATQKQQEHEQEMEKLQSDFSKAVMRLSGQSSQIAELQSQHAAQLEQLRADADADHTTALDALKEDHKKTIEALKLDMESKQNEAIKSLQSEHVASLDALKNQYTTTEDKVAELRASHARSLEESKASAEQQRITILEQAKNDHSKAMENIRSEHEAKQSAIIQELQQKHTSELTESMNRSNQTSEQAKLEHDQLVTKLKSDLEAVCAQAKDTSELDSLKTKLANSEEAMERMQEAQAEMMTSISNEHETEVGKLQQELNTLRQTTEKLRDPAEIDALQDQLAQAHSKNTDLTSQHAKALDSLDQEHRQAISRLRDEVAKTRVESTSEIDAEMHEVKNLLSEAKQTITQLSEQYAHAAADAESQRLAADRARRELVELKRVLTQAETNGTDRVTPIKVTKTKDLVGEQKTQPSPKAGLGASRWAAAEPGEPPQTGEDSHGSDRAAEGDVPAMIQSTEQDSQDVQPKKRNVHGQMASIHESIRQLDEMSVGFLEEHQRMARTLSRVEEDGTLTRPLEE